MCLFGLIIFDELVIYKEIHVHVREIRKKSIVKDAIQGVLKSIMPNSERIKT